MSLGEHIMYWWAGLTMEEVFLVTWGSIIVPPMLGVVVWAIVRHLKQKRRARKEGDGDDA